MNAIDLLTTQHRKMESSFRAVIDAEGPSRAELFCRAADVLMSHVEIEEQLFYPAVEAHRTEDILLESLEEHLSLKRLLADLVHLQPDAETFEPKLHVLLEQAEHHHEEEEEKLFPGVKKLLSTDELEKLGSDMEALQVELLKKAPRKLAERGTDQAASLR